MDKAAFISEFRQLLVAVKRAPHDRSSWAALAHHIDGRILNHEGCLASQAELAELDENGLVPWSKYIWEHVLELAPNDLEALGFVVEYRVDVLDDLDAAAAPLAALLSHAPEHPTALHYAVALASANDDLEEARRRLLDLCRVSPETAVCHGTFDFFDEDDLGFLAEVAPKLIDVIDAEGEPLGYMRSLRTLLATLPEGGPAAVKRFDVVFMPQAVRDVPVSDLELSLGARWHLNEARAEVVADIVRLSEQTTRTFPLAFVHQIGQALQARGVRFADPKWGTRQW